MSETVSKALLHVFGSRAKATSEFIGYIDKFFDCLNVTNYTNGIHKRKPSQHPYRSLNDQRLSVSECNVRNTRYYC